MEESRKRTIIKGITWRLVSSLQSFFVMLFFTENVSDTLKMIIIFNLSGFVLFYLHERIWNRSKWGTK